MPFTLSHAAIALPVKKWNLKWVNFTAIIIGTMAPDFEYFIRFAPSGIIGHRFLGFIYFNLPLVFAIAFTWNYIIKEPLIQSMPRKVTIWCGVNTYKRIRIKTINEFVIFSYSAIIGMITHVIWDGFTHRGGMFVNNIPLLSKKIYILSFSIPVYKFIQHGSTIIGGVYIIIFLYNRRNKNYRLVKYYPLKKKVFYWTSIVLIAIVLYLYKVVFIMGEFNFKSYGILIVSLISSFIIGVIITSLLYTVNKNKYKNINP